MSGIVGVYSLEGKNVADLGYGCLVSLQHRGEAAAGISIATDDILTDVERGQTRENIEPILPFLLKANPFAMIGHSLYEMDAPSQPLYFPGERNISFAMDGHIIDRNPRDVSSVFVKHFIEGGFEQGADRFMDRYKNRGSYCITSLIEKDDDISLVVLRDPKGIRPLCLGQRDRTYVIASENCALDDNHVEFVRDINPGELLVINKNGLKPTQIREENHAHCMFEWIYFGNIGSSIEGVSVAEVRDKLGKMLAYKYKLDVDIVGASPDSGRGVAAGFAEGLTEIRGKHIPYVEAIIKKAGSPRTFQVEARRARELAARHKFRVISYYVKGKKIAIGEDSIVRGNVSQSGYIPKIREAGAREVHLGVSCPPLFSGCFKKFGDKRIATNLFGKSLEEINRIIAEKIGADSVCYSSLEMVK